MKHKIFTTFLFIFLFSMANAQELQYDEVVDNETYKYYSEKNWDKLIQVGLEAKERGISFYYLNQRIGLAYFYKENYRRSIPFFKQAAEESPINTEFLYFAYLYAGRENDAKIFAKLITEETKEQNNIKSESVFTKIFINGNYLLNSDINKLQNIDIDGVDNVYGEQSYATNHKLFTVGLENNLGKRFVLNYSYSNILMNQNQIINSYETKSSFNTSNLQQQFYVNLNYHFAESYDLSVAFNYLDIKTSTNIYTQNSIYSDLTVHDTYNIFDTVYQADAVLNVYDTIYNYNHELVHTISDTIVKWSDMVLAFSIWKDVKLLKIGLHGNYSKLNNKSFVQAGATLVYFPFGNLNFYSQTDFTTKLDFLDRNNTGVRPGFYANQLIGVKVFKNFWTEGFYSYGILQDFSSNDAFVVYNTAEKIIQSGGINFSYLMFNQKIKLDINCLFMQKEHSYLTYVFDSNQQQVFQGIRHESYTYEDNSVYWTTPQNIEVLKSVPTYLPVVNTAKYISYIFSIGLSYSF